MTETMRFEKLRRAAAGQDHSGIAIDRGSLEGKITFGGLTLAALFNHEAMREKMGLTPELAMTRSREFLRDYIAMVERKLTEYGAMPLQDEKKKMFLEDLATSTITLAKSKGLDLDQISPAAPKDVRHVPAPPPLPAGGSAPLLPGA